MHHARKAAEAIAECSQASQNLTCPDVCIMERIIEDAMFEQWKQFYAPNDSGEDYDLRAAFSAGAHPDASGHWPDLFKKPNHPTFSVESVYAVGSDAAKAGKWKGNRFIPPQGNKVNAR